MTAPLIHPTAHVDPGAIIGEGCRIWHGVHVMSGARIGRACVLGQGVFVAASVSIGDDCKIQNHVSLYDGVVLEDGVFVGPSATFTNVRRPRAKFPRRDQFERTLIREGATIGGNATIRCGVTVGRCGFVAAGAVVTHDVADFVLVAGNPAVACGYACRCGERVDSPPSTCRACGRAYRTSPSGGLLENES